MGGSSMSAIAGRVLQIHKGAYDAATAYSPLDEVLYQGSTYVCKQNSTGNLPTNTTYWQLVAQKGDDGSNTDPNAVHWEDNGILGVKNLLNNIATTQTINGVTFTVNADKSVTVNGTASATVNLELIKTPLVLTEDCILTGTPSGGQDKYRIMANNGSTWFYDVTGVILPSGTYTRVLIQIVSGQTINNLVFKPMIRLASDTDNTYTPYAMTNRELTANVIPEDITSILFSDIPEGITLTNSSNIVKIGNIICGEIVLTRTSFESGTQYTLTIDSKYRPKKNYNTTGVYTNEEWSGMSDAVIGYFFMGNGGACNLKQSSGVTKTVFKGQFMYSVL
jgi:hypothetical protein